jgi:Ankyrin repeats (many copies)
VVVLLKAGHAVNALTGSGAALHEAALCGKTSVVRALLARGADPRIHDHAGDTVLDALARFPPHVTHDIVALINSTYLNS